MVCHNQKSNARTTWNQATTAFFHTLSNSLFTDHPMIWHGETELLGALLNEPPISISDTRLRCLLISVLTSRHMSNYYGGNNFVDVDLKAPPPPQSAHKTNKIYCQLISWQTWVEMLTSQFGWLRQCWQGKWVSAKYRVLKVDTQNHHHHHHACKNLGPQDRFQS
jgi:hypothetical protein